MITPDEQRQTIHRLEWLTHLTGHLLLVLALVSLTSAIGTLLTAALLACVLTGGGVGWIRREQSTPALWYVMGAGAAVVVGWTLFQAPRVPMTFDGVLGLLGRFLAGLGACQAFERASRRATTLRQTIALVLLAVAATTTLRDQPAGSLGILLLCLAVWIYARRSALLLDKLRQGPLTLVNLSMRHYHWLGQAGSAAIALGLIGACALALFWQTPRVPLPSLPVLQAPFGGTATGSTTPHTEEQSVAGYLESELMDTLQQIGRAKNLQEVDYLRQQAQGLLTFLEEEGKVESKQLELLRKFSDRLNQRRVRQLAEQEETRRRQTQQQRTTTPTATTQPQPLEQFREEMDFLREFAPELVRQLEQRQQQLAQSTTTAQARQTQAQMEQMAGALSAPLTVETPALQQLIRALAQDQLGQAGQAEAAAQRQAERLAQARQTQTEQLRAQFAQLVLAFTAGLQRDLRQQPPNPAWQQRTEALRTADSADEALQQVAALMDLLAQAAAEQQLTPAQTSTLARQLDQAGEVRTQVDREELRPPVPTDAALSQAQMAMTAAALQEAAARLQQATAQTGANPSTANQQAAVELRTLQAQQALQQAAHEAQRTIAQAAVPFSEADRQAMREAVNALVAASTAAEAQQAAGRVEEILERNTQTMAAVAVSSAVIRQATSDILQKQTAAATARASGRRFYYFRQTSGSSSEGRPHVLITITVEPAAAATAEGATP